MTAVAGGFLLHQLHAWQPHEDETLALFVGRQPLGSLFETVLEERGGAPLHFLFAWVVAHLGFGLGGLRVVSAAFAIASLPLVALLGRRLAGRREALVATVIVAASWMFLFHGVYGRMYSLFLCTSALSYLAFLCALDRGGRRAWALWVGAILLTVATHPYGALVLASQGAYVLLGRRDRFREALVPFAAVGVLGLPFWLATLVLAGRFDVGVGGGGARLGGPTSVLEYLWHVAGAFSAAWLPATLAVLGVVALGLVRLRRSTVLLMACVVGVPDRSPSSRPVSAARPRRRRGTSSSPCPSSRSRSRPASCGSAPSCRSRSPRSSSRRSRGRGSGRRRSSSGSPTSGRPRAPTRPRTSPPRAGPTTSCSATSRSTSAPGSATATSRSPCCPARTRSSRSRRCSSSTGRSGGESGSSTRARTTTSRAA